MTGFIAMIVEAGGCDRDMLSVAAEIEAIAQECLASTEPVTRPPSDRSLLRTARRLVTVSTQVEDDTTQLRISTSSSNGAPNGQRRWLLKHDLGLGGWPQPPERGEAGEIAEAFSFYASVLPSAESMIDGPAREEVDKLRQHAKGIALAAMNAGIANDDDKSYAIVHYGRREPCFETSGINRYHSHPMGCELDDLLADIRPVHRISVNLKEDVGIVAVTPHRCHVEARHVHEMPPIERMRIMRDPRYAAIRFDKVRTVA